MALGFVGTFFGSDGRLEITSTAVAGVTTFAGLGDEDEASAGLAPP